MIAARRSDKMGDLTMNVRLPALPALTGTLKTGDGGGKAGPPTNIADAAVQVIANGCREVEVHGAGMMVADGKIATVAHVVAGATSVDVRGANGSRPATVVYFDPVLDVAVL